MDSRVAALGWGPVAAGRAGVTGAKRPTGPQTVSEASEWGGVVAKAAIHHK